MAVKIKLKRVGKVHAPQYRVIVADSRTKRDGRAIEEIGIYQPMQEPSLIQIDSARAQYWLGVGATPTDAVLVLLKITGDWQKFKGLPGQEGTLQTAPPKPSRVAAFEAAAQDAADEPATTARAAKAVADAAVASAVAVAAADEAVLAEAEAIVEIAEANAGEIPVEQAEEAIVVAAAADEVADAAAAVADEAVEEAVVALAEDAEESED